MVFILLIFYYTDYSTYWAFVFKHLYSWRIMYGKEIHNSVVPFFWEWPVPQRDIQGLPFPFSLCLQACDWNRVVLDTSGQNEFSSQDIWVHSLWQSEELSNHSQSASPPQSDQAVKGPVQLTLTLTSMWWMWFKKKKNAKAYMLTWNGFLWTLRKVIMGVSAG